MTEDQLELLLKARQSLSAARVLLDNGFPTMRHLAPITPCFTLPRHF
jgi:hypothetical protein